MNQGAFTVSTYFVLIALWGGLVFVYLRHRGNALARDPLVASLLAVMALDALKNFVESVYFGVLWGARYEVLPRDWGAPLESPVMLALPKLFNIAVAVILLWRVAGRVIPDELRDRDQRREQEARLRAEQQVAMARVQESERRLQSLFSATTDVVSFWVPGAASGGGAPGSLVLESLNPAARNFFSVSDDVVGQQARVLLGADFAVLLEEALSSKQPVRRDAAPIATQNGLRTINTQVVPVVDDHGVVVRVAALSHDITELTKKAAEEEQRTRLESLGLLAGGVAHDFNNLLAVVKADVDLARTGGLQGSGGADRALSHAGDAIARARELVEQLMATAGARARQSEPVDVAAVVKDTVRLLAPSSDPVRLSTTSSAPAWVNGDRAQLQQIVLNLVQNAVEAVSDARASGGTVRADVSVGDDVVVVVEDDGAGIPADVQARMFDPFFTTKKDGRGLGLSTVFGLVQTHGGKVEVGSEPGKGARFTITLPKSPPPPPEVLARLPTPVSSMTTPPPLDAPAHLLNVPMHTPVMGTPAPPPSTVPGTLRVLLIDDDDPVRRASRRLLERLGHSVIDVASGKDALQVPGDAYDVAVVDVTMPDLDGPATLQQLRKLRPGLPAVIVTGRGDVVVDGDIVLPKPFDVEGLEGALKRAFEKRGVESRDGRDDRDRREDA